MSGLMVSAGDFGYIPSVVFVSYFGSKGNRARWIGAGSLMIAFADILIGMSNFLFPVQTTQFNSTFIESSIIADRSGLNDSVQASTYLNYAKIFLSAKSFPLDQSSETYALTTILRQFVNEELSSCYERQNTSDQLCALFFSSLQLSNQSNVTEISKMRGLISSPFFFCHAMFNSLKQKMDKIRCSSGLSNMGPFITIFAGLFILGIGRTMPHSLGLPLIDDNVKRQNLPLYFAGMFFIRILGPFLGFLIGSIVNNYYYSFYMPVGLTPRDPSWIGRWWAGFLGIGIIMLCPSLILFLYPTCVNYRSDHLREHYSVGKNNLNDHTPSEIHSLLNERLTKGEKLRDKGLALIDRHAARNEEGNTVVPTSAKAKIIDFISTVQTIVKSPIYVFSMIGRIMDVFAFKGFFIFLPKYLAVQFGLPQHKINLFLGLVSLPGLAIGLFIGGLIMRKFRLQGRKAAAYIFVCSLIAALFSLHNAMIGCKSVLSLISDKAKLTDQNFTTTCNSDCNCIGAPLYPVCNRQGQTFYSPCHAGCSLDQSFSNPSTVKIFQNCSCSNNTDNEVSRDFCDQTICERKFAWYFVNLAFSGIFGGMGIIPAVLIVLRSVPPVDRSISLGFQGFLVSLTATLPSSVFWGWIIDKACVMWNTVCLKRSRGACQLYDTDKLRLMTHLTYGIMRLVSSIPDIAVFYFANDLLLTDYEANEKVETEESPKCRRLKKDVKKSCN
ncbi:sodium-independent organic anion transporter family protein [Acanthocheilonema viteae]